jgi:hypothetical protein
MSDRSVSVPFFVSVTKLMCKTFGKGIVLSVEQMERVRQAAAELEAVGEECRK